MYAFLIPAGIFNVDSLKASITHSFFISRPARLSCMLSKLRAASIAAGSFPENCTKFQQQQNIQYFSIMLCD